VAHSLTVKCSDAKVRANKKKGKKKAGKGVQAANDATSATVATLDNNNDGDADDTNADNGEMINVQCIYAEHTSIQPFYARLPATGRLTSAQVEATLQQQTLLELRQLSFSFIHLFICSSHHMALCYQ
jgi:hypothetical protein